MMPASIENPTLMRIESSGRGSHYLDRRRQRDRFVQRAIKRAVHGVKTMRALDCCLGVRGSHQAHRYVNAADNQYIVLRFHIAGYIRSQLAVAGIDLARFQRTSKGTHHSTSGCSDDVVNR
jgi:hypothetical protein